MKSVLAFSLVFALLGASAPLAAGETSGEASDAVETAVVETAAADRAETAPIVLFESPLVQPAGAAMSCVECYSNADCYAVCGGFGMCARDFGNECGVGSFTKVCHCN